MNSKISVIIPVYNIEEYLERCLDSVIAQTYTNLEIIVVDDGSTDSSPSICDEYAGKDERIKVIHKKNGGLSDARNAGLKVATGDYVGYVDGDDWVDATMYEDMLNACVKNDAQVAVCRYKRVYKDETMDGSSKDVVVLSKEETWNIYINAHPQYVIYNSVWSKLFRRDMVEDLEFPVGRNSEDIVYTTKAFCRMDRCVYLDTAYYNYVIDRDGSIMNVKSGKRSVEDEIPFFYEQIEILRDNEMEHEADMAQYQLYRRLLYYFLGFYKNKENRVYAEWIANRIRSEKQEIMQLYSYDFIKKGDLVRMQLFMKSPVLYYSVNALYENVILPIRRRL